MLLHSCIPSIFVFPRRSQFWIQFVLTAILHTSSLGIHMIDHFCFHRPSAAAPYFRSSQQLTVVCPYQAAEKLREPNGKAINCAADDFVYAPPSSIGDGRRYCKFCTELEHDLCYDFPWSQYDSRHCMLSGRTIREAFHDNWLPHLTFSTLS